MNTIPTLPAAAVFLDRDGTLNVDRGFVHRWEDWHWLPGVKTSLKRLAAAGYMLIVVSNQSGIARGYYSCDDMLRLHARVNQDLAELNIGIDAFYCCPHHPEYTGKCACRKPAPGLILRAARDLKIDLAQSWLIGDKPRDIQAAKGAGVRGIFVETGPGGQKGAPPGVPVMQNLERAADYIIALS